jgi:AraC family transcriptional regulator
MQRSRLYLEGNLDRVVRVSELAELNNVSVWHFTKSFQAIYGESPQVAAPRQRLAHAAQLLLTTRLAVSEVGMACGFENNCSFSRAFRALYGVPPSRYRLRGGPIPTDVANIMGTHCQAMI